MLIFWVFLLSFYTFATSEVEDAKLSIKSLITPILAGQSQTRPKGTEKFRVDTCPKKKIDWMNVLMMKEEATLDYKFKVGCDIEGTVKPKVFQAFPVNLKLRNIRSYSNVTSQNTITAQLEGKPILNLAMRSGILSGNKSHVKFEADYQVQINPMSEKAIEKNLGGELRITEINGKKVNIKEKILVN